MATILCVDDEPAVLLLLRAVLDQAGHLCTAVTNVEAALNVLARGTVDLILCDYRMPEASGLELLGRLAETGADIPLIMVTGYGSIEHAVASLKAGAVDYITKPVRPDRLGVAVEHALEFARLRRETVALGIAQRHRPTESVTVDGIPLPAETNPSAAISLRTLNIADAEAALITQALAVTNRNRTRAAELLGISVRTLRNKLNRNVAAAAE